jgi:CheY-specific phosphatase CheX
MLGLEPDEVEADIETLGTQAVCELANVIGGELIVMLGGKDVEFTLGLPESCDASAVPKNDSHGCFLESEGELLEVHIQN